MSDMNAEAQADLMEDENANEMTEEISEELETETLTLEQQLEKALEEAAHNLDGWQRAQAELANARKRFEKQRQDTFHMALSDVISKLLPVLDDFERAMDNVPSDISENAWFDGVALVQKKFLTLLENLNIQPIEAVGQPFDPVFHEAIMQEASDEHESGVVTREMQKGYQIGARVIRPSLVYVAA